jgi:uncharacterized protein YhbP (UPF0306 family)
MSAPDARAEIAQLLARQSTLTLATLEPSGLPMAASLFFAADPGLNLYWTSSSKSRHSQNLSRDPHVAITVHTATWSWRAISGLQFEGEAAEIAPGTEWQSALDLYLSKFPFAKEFEAELSRSSFYRFTPRWGRLIDNSRGFGYKEEISF